MDYKNNANGWYTPAPTVPPTPVRDPEAEARAARRTRRTKVTALCVCAVLVCAAAGLAALHTMTRARQWGAAETVPYGEGLFDFGGSDAEQYDDFREYFENYFAPAEEIGMPAADAPEGMTLKLWPSQGEELSLQEIYEQVSPAVVGITAQMGDFGYSWGTGVVFDPEGYIITNTHILQGCSGATVEFADGREYEAKLVGADEASDIAVIVIDAEEELPYARFGRSGSLRVGDEVVAIGNPLSSNYSGTMTNGIISAIDRNIYNQGHTMTMLQTNAALNEGNSGGPLINARGQIVGITNMKIMYAYMANVEGIGFAVPSSVVKEVADQLMAKGYVSGEPTIGIIAGSVSQEAMDLYGLPEGVYVSQVNEGSDALAKGLQEGDVITAVNGTHVSSVAEVNFIKDGFAVGDSLTLTVYREGETFEVEVELVDNGAVR